jgi:hypothetical protein
MNDKNKIKRQRINVILATIVALLEGSAMVFSFFTINGIIYNTDNSLCGYSMVSIHRLQI